MEESSRGPTTEKKIVSDNKEYASFNQPIKWFNVILLSIIHLLGVYGIWNSINSYPISVIFNLIYGYTGGFGVTGGAHRYWTHRSYKAKLPLRVILTTAYLSAGMNSIHEWVRDHRVHHKFSETDADPHNAKRGLFFSHVGWLLQKKHPEVKRRGCEVDMSDIKADPLVAFQEKYFLILQPLITLAIPICIPVYFWGETWWNSFFCSMSRWAVLLNVVWSVNSFAHIYGYHPYNRNINPAENIFVSFFALGEGWHNYHHTFPWDYRTSEFSFYFNITGFLLEMFAKIGWAYDLRKPSKSMIEKAIISSGDGTHYKLGRTLKMHDLNQNEESEKSL